MPGFGATIAAACALVLCWSGLIKVAQPLATRRLLHGLGLPSHVVMARAIGVVELAIGAAALSMGGVLPAGVLAGAYAAFAVVSFRSMTSGAASCGCFGDRSAPPGWVQVVTNLGCVAAATTWGIQGGEALWTQPRWFLLSVFAVLTGRIIVALHTEVATVLAATAALRTRGVAT
jgi:uncharacterized protein YjeT (DUF2065 family)